MIRWAGIWDAIDPRCIRKRYTVDCDTWYNGASHDFWTLRRAQAFFESQRGRFRRVRLTDGFRQDDNGWPLVLMESVRVEWTDQERAEIDASMRRVVG